MCEDDAVALTVWFGWIVSSHNPTNVIIDDLRSFKNDIRVLVLQLVTQTRQLIQFTVKKKGPINRLSRTFIGEGQKISNVTFYFQTWTLNCHIAFVFHLTGRRDPMSIEPRTRVHSLYNMIRQRLVQDTL